MFEMRKIKKAIEQYEYALTYTPEEVKYESDIYLNDLTILSEILEVLIENCNESLQFWSILSINNSLSLHKNFSVFRLFNNLLGKWFNFIVSILFDKLDLLLNYQFAIISFSKRFEQFKLFCPQKNQPS